MEGLFFLFILLAFITIVGCLIWLGFAAVYRWVFVDEKPTHIEVLSLSDPLTSRLKNLKTTEQQIVQFYQDGKLNDQAYEQVMSQMRAQRERLVNPTPAKAPAPTNQAAGSADRGRNSVAVPPVKPASVTVLHLKPAPATEQASFISNNEPQRPPRRSFSEVLNSFMEESNIRWGEIIGGLLIIGCSTALVISLWAQISEIPVLKFLIFTTVTAVLFGVGLYSEHHWKLPTTSRGILTIATLLVPLNFLAIAAVSSSTAPSGVGVFVGEIIAPAIFLCLLYFAGRVITPDWPHLVAAGALGSSVGQLLIRHLAGVDNSTALLIFLAAFPVVFYVAACAWMLKLALADGEIDGDEATEIFITLGALTFA